MSDPLPSLLLSLCVLAVVLATAVVGAFATEAAHRRPRPRHTRDQVGLGDLLDLGGQR